MKIDILSDLHIDFYFSQENLSKNDVKNIFDNIFLKNERIIGDVLVVAGDLGHNNLQNISILKIIRELYYKNIIIVLGNHDYYLMKDDVAKYNSNSFSRVKEMRSLINEEKNIYCLDGNVVEIDGIRFGGADGWYSDAYLVKYFSSFAKSNNITTNELANLLWKMYLNDSRHIYNIDLFDEIYFKEISKIESVYKECDIMITHVNPSYLEEHIDEKYKNDKVNTFFTFDGHKYLKNGTMKHWIFGHTHSPLKYSFEDVDCICSPLGYPYESKNIQIESIVI